MPGIFRYSLDQLDAELTEVVELGIPSIMLFGIPKLMGLDSLFGDGGGQNPFIQTLQNATRAGTSFVFGYVGDNSQFPANADSGPPPLFFFQILPLIIVVASL